MKLKRSVMMMMVTCLLLGVAVGGSKQEDVKEDTIVEVQLCEGIINPGGELL